MTEQNSEHSKPQKSEAERIADLELRMSMLENAFSQNSKLPDTEKVRKIEQFLINKLGMPAEAPSSQDPLKS